MLEDYLNRGRKAFQEQRYQEAFQLLSQALGKIEDQQGGEWLEDQIIAELYLLRGTSLLAQNEQDAFEDPDIFNQIIDDYEQTLEMNPENVEAYVLRGRLYLNCVFTNYTEEARKDFAEVLKREPEHWETLNYMAQLFYGQEEYDKSIYYFTKVIEQQDTVEAYELRALAFFQKLPPDYGSAASDFEKAKQLNPEREEFYIWKSQCFQELDLFEDAIKEYDQLIARLPGEAKYWLDRSTLKLSLDPEGALEDLQHAIELEPGPLAYNNRAFYHKMQGNLDQALEDALLGLTLKPDTPILYATLAEIYADMGDEEMFYHYLKQALEHYYEDIVDARSESSFQAYANDSRFLTLLETHRVKQKPDK